MSSAAGKDTVVKVSAMATPSYPIVLGGLSSVAHEGIGANVEDASFGDSFIPRLGNLRDAKVTLEGARRASDAGQVILLNALKESETVWMTIRPFLQEMHIAKFTTDVQIDGRAQFTCELEGTGALTQSLPGLKIGTQDLDYIRTQDDDYLTTETN